MSGEACEWCAEKAVARVVAVKTPRWVRFACGTAHLEAVYRLGQFDFGDAKVEFTTVLDDRGFALPPREPYPTIKEGARA